MAPKQMMRIANEKASKYVTMRGNVPKSSVSFNFGKLLNIQAVSSLSKFLKKQFSRKFNNIWYLWRWDGSFAPVFFLLTLIFILWNTQSNKLRLGEICSKNNFCSRG